jgi:hypothetical protein
MAQHNPDSLAYLVIVFAGIPLGFVAVFLVVSG